jgi:hypothetical protein
VAGTCDVAESCDGASSQCPTDGFVASATVCRPSLGVCDVAEQCTGAQAQCPTNAFVPATTVCRPALDVCDRGETCTGSSATCPGNAFEPAGTSCRPAAGLCDAAEACTGTGIACPADQLQPSTFVCRPAQGACDLDELCAGSGTACPADTGLPDGDGDGTCDAEDGCPADPDPTQDDADGDGTGDACDPCSNFLPVLASRPNVKITKLLTPPGDDRLKFSGAITVPATPAIDPLTNGIRVILADASGALVVDATLPGGLYDPFTRAGWKVNGTNTTYTYRNAGVVAPLVQGISKVVVKKSTRTPGAVQFSVTGKDGSYGFVPAELPLVGTLVLDPPYAATNQCGEALFPGPSPSCTYLGTSGVLKCR